MRPPLTTPSIKQGSFLHLASFASSVQRGKAQVSALQKSSDPLDFVTFHDVGLRCI